MQATFSLKRFLEIFLISVVVIGMVSSCNTPKKEAQKAAEHAFQSIRHIQHMEYDKAEEAFRKAEEIIDKYRSRDDENSKKFFEHYYRQLQENSKQEK